MNRPNSPLIQYNRDWSLGRDLAALIDDRTGRNLINNQNAPTITGTAVRGVGYPISGQTRGYGSTYGAGTTDMVTTAFTGNGTRRTYAIWGYRSGVSAAGISRVFDKFDTGSGNIVDSLYYNNTGPVYEYRRYWTGGVTQWTVSTIPSIDTWALFVVTYVSTAGVKPNIYINNAELSVTTSVDSSGTVVDTAAPYCIGNRISDSARVWEGMLGPLLIWDRILSPGEIWSLYDPMTRWSMYWRPSTTVWFNIPSAGGRIFKLAGDGGGLVGRSIGLAG